MNGCIRCPVPKGTLSEGDSFRKTGDQAKSCLFIGAFDPVDPDAVSFHPPEPGFLPLGKLMDSGIQPLKHMTSRVALSGKAGAAGINGVLLPQYHVTLKYTLKSISSPLAEEV